MMESRKKMWWAIISFIIGILLGPGIIWQSQQLDLASKSQEIEKISTTADLRKQIGEVYSQIIELSNEYIKTRNSFEQGRNANEQNEILKLNSQLEILKDDFKSLENKLAKLENRSPRKIKIDFIPPDQPGKAWIKP